MPRPRMRRDSVAADVAAFLKEHPEGATLTEIRAGVERRRGTPVLAHSLRAAIYHHLGDAFERGEGRGYYRLRAARR